jgi:hypothetical protein
MPTIDLEPELYKRVKEAAAIYDSTVGEILSQAIRRFVWELEQRKISEETRIYHEKFAELKGQYLGQYIAMHEGQVVDHDTDLTVLRKRIHQQYERIPVMITLVEEVADPPLVRRDFRMETTD